jgi:hypothetical protein
MPVIGIPVRVSESRQCKSLELSTIGLRNAGIVYNVHLQMNSISEKKCGIEKFSGRLFSFSGKPQQSAENGGQPYLFIGGDTGTC